ncbi:hypothetical protein MNEG_3498 [Monoraphidium neglectum]|uniref:Uncharacterized protein n=1 Tax=Monoraphidium neglectum TaxID=145388 RepID=A0A0D2MVC5_9CHLO|nr:hypothetical protein MNEG_3498 [Monoraphidium neglectum]KIZ04467.1 hypothetical protein MNEG_3498 [Monoraphidium neglectum]|eukprot:XP_013903486.1 hypothetical protein MNEG_3498 [Monoraphidium neglectum]
MQRLPAAFGTCTLTMRAAAPPTAMAHRLRAVVPACRPRRARVAIVTTSPPKAREADPVTTATDVSSAGNTTNPSNIKILTSFSSISNSTSADAPTPPSWARYGPLRKADLVPAAALRDGKTWAANINYLACDANSLSARSLRIKADAQRKWANHTNGLLPGAERASLARLSAATAMLGDAMAAGAGCDEAQLAAVLAVRKALPAAEPAWLPPRPRHPREAPTLRTQCASDAQALGLLATVVATLHADGLEGHLADLNNADPKCMGFVSGSVYNAVQQFVAMSRHTANLCAASRDALASGVVRRAEAVQRACAAADEALRQADAIAAGAAARLAFPLEEHLSAACGDDDDEYAAQGPSGGKGGDQQQGGDGPDAGTPAIIVRRGPKPDGNLDGGEGAQAQPEPARTASSGRRAAAPGGPCSRPQRALGWAKAALARGFGLCGRA